MRLHHVKQFVPYIALSLLSVGATLVYRLPRTPDSRAVPISAADFECDPSFSRQLSASPEFSFVLFSASDCVLKQDVVLRLVSATGPGDGTRFLVSDAAASQRQAVARLLSQLGVNMPVCWVGDDFVQTKVSPRRGPIRVVVNDGIAKVHER